MEKSTLCYCINEEQILLGLKKRGFGCDKLNGYGGKIEENESPLMATIRELKEESGLITSEDNLKQVALIHFYFDENHVFDCYVFLLYVWKGNPIETEEMSPQWRSIANLPFDEMWIDDAMWMPLILAGEKIEAEIKLSADGLTVKEFNYKPL
ncbi:MAG: 8-oxo-dGTP diphosphatase [Patescibacteria group bacterium]